MSAYPKPNRGDWKKSIFLVGVYVAVISVSSFFLFTVYWHLWVLLVAGGLAVLVLWHAISTAYHCSKCGAEFEISFFSPSLAPVNISFLYLGRLYYIKKQ